METPQRLALRLAYLGATFAGWQRQPGKRTVQGVLEAALTTLYGQPVQVVGAGRTDAGVHAAGQVAHFDAPLPIPPAGVVRALAGLLPPEVRVMRAWTVGASFHARRAALAKRYRYRIAWRQSLPPWEALRRWAVPHKLDPAAMRACLIALVGEQDFAAFAISGHSGRGARGTVRTITMARLVCRGRRGDVVLVGDGFLRGMARRIVGALVEVGRGAQPPEWINALLTDPRTRPPAPTAPAHGLTLEHVLY
jgi:tRNA pseudouridine38-40 synthase